MTLASNLISRPSLALTGSTDVFISGGGPAGLACAIALALKGVQVLVADGMRPPIDKACGEGLMPDTLFALAELGIQLDCDAGRMQVEPGPNRHARARMQGIRFIDAANGNVAQASFPCGGGIGMKRLLLHRLLLDRALSLGVQFSWETVVRGIVPEETNASRWTRVETSRGSIAARFVIGADGHQSRIRAWAGLDRSSVTARRIGLRQHFAVEPATLSGFVEVYWSGRGQAYVTPVAPNEICVAFVAHRKFASVADALAHFPQLQARLAEAQASDAPRGSVTFSRKLHRVTRGNVALVGDASGSVDAVTGEGLSLCFRQALALSEAIAAKDLAVYQREHSSMRRLPHLMAGMMLLMDRSALLRSCVIAAFERHPGIFAQLLALHIGQATHRFQSPEALPLALLALPPNRTPSIPRY